MKEFCNEISSVFDGVILLDLYPKSQIDLQIFVLESDGGHKSAAFNAATLALVDAGIPMRDFVVSTTSGLLGSVAVLDLILAEEKKQNCEFMVAYLLKS
jgi:exosome complex component RRP41